MAGASAHTTTRRILDTCAEEMQMRQLLSTISSDNWAKRSIVKAAGGTELHLGDLAGLSAMLSCPMCKGTLRHPVFLSACTPQHHFFCGECLANFTRDKDNASQCPVCATHFSHSQIKPDKQLAGITKLLAGEPVPLPGFEGAGSGCGLGSGSSGGGGGAGGAGGKRKRGGSLSPARGAAAAAAAAASAAAEAGEEASGEASAPALNEEKERITFKMVLPLPPGFPNPLSLSADSDAARACNKKTLIVPYDKTVARNKEYIMEPLAIRNAAAQGIPGFDKSRWALEFSVGGAQEQDRVVLPHGGASLCDEVRAAQLRTGLTEEASRPKCASAVAGVPPMGTVYVRVLPLGAGRSGGGGGRGCI